MKNEPFDAWRFIGIVLLIVASSLGAMVALGILGHIAWAFLGYGWHLMDTLTR